MNNITFKIEGGQKYYFDPEKPQGLYTYGGLSKSDKAKVDKTEGNKPTAIPTKEQAQGKTPEKIAQSKNPAVNFYTKQVAIKEQEYKKSVAQDGKKTVSNQTAQAKAELETAKKNLDKELRTPLK